MVTGVNHVQVNVPTEALAAADEFYRGFMGFTPIPRPDSFASPGLWYNAGDFELHIGVEDHVDRQKTRAHVAYEVIGLHAWRAKVAAKGWAIKEQPKVPGWNRFQFRDPFGNNLELIERESSTGG